MASPPAARRYIRRSLDPATKEMLLLLQPTVSAASGRTDGCHRQIDGWMRTEAGQRQHDSAAASVDDAELTVGIPYLKLEMLVATEDHY